MTSSRVAQLPPGARVFNRIVALRPCTRADTPICTQPSPSSVFGSTVDAATRWSWTISSLDAASAPPDFTQARTVHQPGRSPLTVCSVVAV